MTVDVGRQKTWTREGLIPALTFREQLKRKYRKYRAVLILVNSLGKAERALIERSLKNIERGSAARLREGARQFDAIFKEILGFYGVVAALDDLEALLASAGERTRVGENTYLLVPKYQLSRAFRHYEKALPIFPKLPLHARIGIDVGTIRETTREMEIFQLEASLFEDMAVLWNEAFRADAVAGRADSTKIQVKLAGASLRAVVKAVFNLLEGYLNGLACDILLKQTVTPEERTKLDEWDAARDRPRFLSLRDKVLQYPRIAIGLEHPPLQENSLPCMRRVLELEIALRHALIHPRPQVYATNPATFREATFFELSIDRVAALCDDVIELILKIADVVGPDYGDVSLWLFPRGSDGFFPESTFF